MKKFFTILTVLLLISPFLMSQQRTGTIYGKVLDEQGIALPGVSLVLTGQYIAPITAISSATGSYRFVSLPPAGDYRITATLQGFKRIVESNIIVRIDFGNVTAQKTIQCLAALEIKRIYFYDIITGREIVEQIVAV